MQEGESKYYILPNVGTSNHDEQIKSIYRIVRIPETFLFKPKHQIGHNSLRHLRKYSKTWKELNEDNHRLANKICEERFILDFDEFILCPIDDKLNEQLFKALYHSMKGEFDKELKGIHLLSKFNRNIEILEESNPDINGVWVAEIKVYNENRNKNYFKKTNFFPKNWTPTQFMFECYYALKNVHLVEGKGTYKGKTLSQIPIKMFFKENKLKSVYPIYLNDKKTATNK